MRVPMNWLKEFVTWKVSTPEIARLLTLHGIEVESVASIENDTVWTLGLTPNRGDCLSIVGVAREVGAVQSKPAVFKPVDPPKGEGPIRDLLSVMVKDKRGYGPPGCPRYMARVIRGVRIGPSPDWLQKRLIQVGLRPINNVVDATNFVMWERGQPLHAFDARFLRGQKIIVQRAGEAQKFISLDGIERSLIPTDLMICDGQAPVAIAGVMGGANSEVCGDTRDLVLEAACFDPLSIRRTSKRLGLISESSKRFERGVDPNGVQESLHRLTDLIIATAGGIPSKDWIDVYPRKISPATIKLEMKEVERILGVAIPVRVCRKILQSLGLSCSKAGTLGLKVVIPTCRPDLTRPIDLIEEIARLYGVEKLEPTLPLIRMHAPATPPGWNVRQTLKQHLSQLGFLETLHLSFVPEKWLDAFQVPADSRVRLANPLSQEGECLRATVLPSLLSAVQFNLNRQAGGLRLYEWNTTFTREGGRVVEKPTLGVVVTGESAKHWRDGVRKNDFYTLKGVLESFGISEKGEGTLLFLGPIPPETLKLWDIDQPVYAMELDGAALVAAMSRKKEGYKPSLKYPYVERDVALIVKEDLQCGVVEESILKENTTLIQGVRPFDVYQGKGVAEGQKSLAFSIRYADPNRTLTDEVVNSLHERLITRLCHEFSATLRK